MSYDEDMEDYAQELEAKAAAIEQARREQAIREFWESIN